MMIISRDCWLGAKTAESTVGELRIQRGKCLHNSCSLALYTYAIHINRAIFRLVPYYQEWLSRFFITLCHIETMTPF